VAFVVVAARCSLQAVANADLAAAGGEYRDPVRKRGAQRAGGQARAKLDSCASFFEFIVCLLFFR
jgi:hypothetical protein